MECDNLFDPLLSERQRALRDEVRAFVRDDIPRELLIDMDNDAVAYPALFIDRAAKHNLLGLRFPQKYGGRDLGWADEVVALEEVGVLGTALACLYSLPTIVGEALTTFGTEEQCQRYLEPTLAGEKCCAEALTEPRGGSDFFGAACTATRDGDDYIIRGQKRFVVGSEGADYFIVYAKTDPDAPPQRSLGLFIVDRTPAVKVERQYDLLGTRGGGTGRLLFDDVRVPRENLVGHEKQGGEIFYRMMIPERMTTAAGVIGLARSALELGARYSTLRSAFGRKIKRFEGVSFKIADAVTHLDAARALVATTAKMIDTAGETEPGRCRRLVSEAKRFSSDQCLDIVDSMMQVLGGIGYTTIYPLERMLRDARIGTIWTGTNEVMNLIIQHEYYKELEKTRAGSDAARDTEGDVSAESPETEKIYESEMGKH